MQHSKQRDRLKAARLARRPSIHVPVILGACMDCTFRGKYRTRTEATPFLTLHLLEHSDHRPLISDARNGWHAAALYLTD